MRSVYGSWICNLCTACLGEKGLLAAACSTDIWSDGRRSGRQMCVELWLCTSPSFPSRLDDHSRTGFSCLVLGEHVTLHWEGAHIQAAGVLELTGQVPAEIHLTGVSFLLHYSYLESWRHIVYDNLIHSLHILILDVPIPTAFHHNNHKK